VEPPAPSPAVEPVEPAPPAAPPDPPPPPAPPAPARAPGAAPARPRFVKLNFDNAAVEVVVQAAAEIVGFNYVLGPNVRGRKVTLQTMGQIGSDEVFPLLLTILEVNGMAAVKAGNVYRIIAREGAQQSPLRTIVGREAAPGPAADEVVTQIVPLQFLDASEAMALLRPFVAQDGALSAHRDTNILILTDTAANIRRLLDILKPMDVADASDEPQVIPLKHADAQELAPVLLQLFTSGRLRAGGVPAGFAAPGPPPAPGAPPRAPTATLDPGGAGDRLPLVVADRRSNSLLVTARKPALETIRRLVVKLDVNVHGGQRVFVYFAENTKARDLAATLDAIYGRGDRATPAGAPSTLSGPGGRPPGPPQPVSVPRSSGPPSSGMTGGVSGGVTVEGVPPQAEIRLVADEVTNAVVVTTYPRLWTEIEETIKKLDKMPRQVLIEVLAAEVTLTDDTKLGMEWALRSGRFDVSSSPSGTLPGRPARSLIPLGGIVPPGLNLFTFAADRFLAALNALATENKVNVLSSPSIMTTENKKAVINVSTSVPVVTSQTTGQVAAATSTTTTTTTTAGLNQTVEYRDAGVILTVTPRIGEQGTVALDVKQEVNSIGPAVAPTNSPSFIKREAETTVVLLSRQTLVMGGLIQDRLTTTDRGIPLLKDIPLIGYLFRFTERLVEKTELLLLITPRVIGTALDAAKITNEMRKATPELDEALRRAPRQPATDPPPGYHLPSPPPAKPPATP